MNFITKDDLIAFMHKVPDSADNQLWKQKARKG